MKRKTLYAFGLSAILGFSTLSGCGCGAVQTSELPQQETSTVEEESTSSTETMAQEETPSVVETEAVETESETASDIMVIEETDNSSEEIEIREMDAIMYATTSVNERKEPSADSEKLATVPAGTAVHVTGITEDEQWYQISDYEDIEVGYISGAYLSSEKPSSSGSNSGSGPTNETASESTEAQQVETPETQAPAETTPQTEAPQTETPAPSTGGSTTTAPNPGAQQVYDQVNQGNAGNTEKTNESMFGNAKDGTGLLSGGQGDKDILGSLHAAPYQ